MHPKVCSYVKTNHHTSTNNRPTPKAFDDYWIVFITAMQIMFDDARHHWVLTTLNDGGVSIHSSLKPNTLTPALEKQLMRLYGPTMSRDATGLCISATPDLYSNRRAAATVVYLPWHSLFTLPLEVTARIWCLIKVECETTSYVAL